jgi:opacity protein-like surface antigen
MKVSAMLLGSLVIFSAAASAQEKAPTPTAELGFSYSYTRVNPGGAISSANANGGYGYGEYNVNRVFGLVAELGANYTGDAGKTLLGNTTFQYLFGPRFNWRKSRFTPYVQTLFGGERFSNGFSANSTSPRLLTSQNNFAAAFGGGVDVNVSSHFAVKPIQLEYLMTQASTGAGNLNFVQNNLRYSAGLVLRFGAK